MNLNILKMIAADVIEASKKETIHFYGEGYDEYEVEVQPGDWFGGLIYFEELIEDGCIDYLTVSFKDQCYDFEYMDEAIKFLQLLLY